MSWRHYDEARALAYDAERAAPDEHLVPVRQLLVAELATMPLPRVVDVGAGTGLWSDRLVRWLSLPVIAVEPSVAMISVLASKNVAGVAVVQARGEALPLRDRSCGAAWLSTVVHHFDDLPAAAAEIARVLAPRGVVLVRSSFPGQSSGDVYPTRFFPSATMVAASFPTMSQVTEAFAHVGLRLRGRHTPSEIASPTRIDFLQRVEGRADSLLQEVSDQEFASGLRALRQWAQAAPHAPVHFQPDVLVFK